MPKKTKTAVVKKETAQSIDIEDCFGWLYSADQCASCIDKAMCKKLQEAYIEKFAASEQVVYDAAKRLYPTTKKDIKEIEELTLQKIAIQDGKLYLATLTVGVAAEVKQKDLLKMINGSLLSKHTRWRRCAYGYVRIVEQRNHFNAGASELESNVLLYIIMPRMSK